jgi:hypothetical protein
MPKQQAAPAMDDSRVIACLRERGLLMLQDKKLESAVAILTGGERLTGSWWSHPKANAIYAILDEVTERPDVLVAKLVQKKVTLVHRRLWPALLGVAIAREAWQVERLSKDAKRMLSTLDEGDSIEPAGPAAKEIELRLLAHATKVHTASGKHVTRLEPWPLWAKRAKCKAIAASEAKQQLALAAIGIGGTPKVLPWVP